MQDSEILWAQKRYDKHISRPSEKKNWWIKMRIDIVRISFKHDGKEWRLLFFIFSHFKFSLIFPQTPEMHLASAQIFLVFMWKNMFCWNTCNLYIWCVYDCTLHKWNMWKFALWMLLYIHKLMRTMHYSTMFIHV